MSTGGFYVCVAITSSFKGLVGASHPCLTPYQFPPCIEFDTHTYIFVLRQRAQPGMGSLQWRRLPGSLSVSLPLRLVRVNLTAVYFNRRALLSLEKHTWLPPSPVLVCTSSSSQYQIWRCNSGNICISAPHDNPSQPANLQFPNIQRC